MMPYPLLFCGFPHRKIKTEILWLKNGPLCLYCRYSTCSNLINKVKPNLFACSSICLFVYLFVRMSVCLSVCLLSASFNVYACLSVYNFYYVCMSVCLSICMSIHLYIYLFIRPSVCQSIYLKLKILESTEPNVLYFLRTIFTVHYIFKAFFLGT